MTREPADPMLLDYLITAGAIHAMTGATYRSVGLRGAQIAATSPEPDGLDDLAGPDTVRADLGDLTVLPAFSDAHEHLMEASRNTLLVPVNSATDRALSTGTSSVLRLASIRCSCASLKAGSTVRSPRSTRTVSGPARSSKPSGSGEVAAISVPRKPTDR